LGKAKENKTKQYNRLGERKTKGGNSSIMRLGRAAEVDSRPLDVAKGIYRDLDIRGGTGKT